MTEPPPDLIIDDDDRPTTRGAFLRTLGVVTLGAFFGGGLPLTCVAESFFNPRLGGPPGRRNSDRQWAGNTPASEVNVWAFWIPFFIGAPIGALVGLCFAWRKNFFRHQKFEWEDGHEYVNPD
jgi:hypothetical protein